MVSLSAKDPSVLGDVATRVAAAISKVPGIEPSSVNNGVVPAGDALEIHVDPAAAVMEGLTPADVANQVNQYLYGTVATQYLGTVQDVGVRLWLDPPQRQIYRDELGDLPIRSDKGKILRLATVAQVSFVAGQPELTRDNLAQVVAVTAELTGSHDLGSTVAAVRKVLAGPGLLPQGVYYTLGGQYEQQQEAVHGMVRVFGAALVAEFILLLFLYERFWLPVIIIEIGRASCRERV